MRLLPLLFLGGSALASMSACGDPVPASSLDDVGEAMDSVEISQKESELFVGSIVTLDPKTLSPDEAAKLAAQRAEKVFSPIGCVHPTVLGNAVSYELVDCWGPFKSATMSGSLDVVYTSDAGGLHASLFADELSIGKARRVTLAIDSDGSYSIDADGVTRRFVVSTHGSGTGSRGNHIERDGSYTLTWNPTTRCATLDGHFETVAGTRSFETTVTGLSRCAGQCPGAGGEIVHEVGEEGRGLTISFDGTSEASWTSTDGASGTIDLFCNASS